LLVGITSASVVLVAPLVAQAGRQLSARSSSSICGKVSAASVSALVGYSVPAATIDTRNLPATSQDGEVSSVVTTCTFGTETTLAALKKDVTLQIGVTSKALSPSQVEKALSAAGSATLKVTVSSFSGLGVPGFYITEIGSGITGEVITGLVGTRSFGASVTQPLSKSKLASLAELAKNL
jgi:hypothetical protein